MRCELGPAAAHHHHAAPEARLFAAWLLIFVASVRELGASILLMGPDSKVLTPAIVEAFFSSSSELTAAMALIQTAFVGVAMLVFLAITRRYGRIGA